MSRLTSWLGVKMSRLPSVMRSRRRNRRTAPVVRTTQDFPNRFVIQEQALPRPMVRFDPGDWAYAQVSANDINMARAFQACERHVDKMHEFRAANQSKINYEWDMICNADYTKWHEDAAKKARGLAVFLFGREKVEEIERVRMIYKRTPAAQYFIPFDGGLYIVRNDGVCFQACVGLKEIYMYCVWDRVVALVLAIEHYEEMVVDRMVAHPIPAPPPFLPDMVEL